MLTVAVLGPVEVHRDGVRLPVPSGKTTEVLVRLALDAGRPVRADRLIDDLWGERRRHGPNTLQSKVSQLRRALDDPDLITSGNGGYTLHVDESGVDALQVLALAASSSAARRSGDAAAAVDIAGEGLALFRGEVLLDAGDGEWLDAHRVRLAEVRLGLVEDLLAARVDLGAGGEVIGELEGLVDRHPLREGLWVSLITALYRTGRQADALAAYLRVRTALVDELGVEPGPELRDLETQILRHSPTLNAGRTAAPLTVGNLPALSSPLVGRADEVDACLRLMGERRLVTLVGPAGVGKTRTAIEVARRLDAPDGVWLIRLDAAAASASIPRMVAETLHLAGGEQLLFDRLAGTATVLVLDNCEHVVDAVADLTARLLDATTDLRILATSQLPLGLDGETVHPLDPLPIADSVALFTARATALRGRFALDDETAATVESVCRALDGLPLAIELAAARIRSLSVREIARRLDDRFALLRDPTSRRPERRRALAAAIGWSYELLFPDDQRGLWALSCFAGGAPLAAAEHVLGALGVPEAAVLDVVGRLVDRSLVSTEEGEDGAVRYRLLDSIRAFAQLRLRESGLADDASAAHAAWFAAVADRCAEAVRGSDQPGCVVAARADRANIDAALAWAAAHDPRLGVRIANGFGWTWVVLGDGVAGATRVRGALDAAADVATPRERATGLLLSGWLEASAGNVERADADLDAALGIAEELSDERLRADAHRHLAFLRIQQGRPHDVLAPAGAGLDVYRRLDLRWETAASLLLAAYGSIMLGDTAGATGAADEAVRLLAPIGDSWAMVHAEAMLGAIAQAEHRFGDAARSLTTAAAESERLGFLGQAALHLTTLGRVQQRAGEAAAATETLDRAIAAATTGGDHRIIATARVHLARLRLAAGDEDAARALLEQNDRWYGATGGGGEGALLTRCLLADRVDLLEAVRDEARAAGNAEVEVLASDGLARFAAAEGRPDAARDLLRTADDLAARIGHVLDDADRFDAHRARAVIGGSAGGEHAVQGRLLRAVDRQGVVPLHLDPGPGVRAPERRQRRLPGRRVLVALGLVDVVGDRPQLGAAEVVGVRLPPRGGPRPRSGAPGLGERHHVVDVDVGRVGPGRAVVGAVPGAGGRGAAAVDDDAGAVALEDLLAGVARAGDGDPVREQVAVVAGVVRLGGDGERVEPALRGARGGDVRRGGVCRGRGEGDREGEDGGGRQREGGPEGAGHRGAPDPAAAAGWGLPAGGRGVRYIDETRSPPVHNGSATGSANTIVRPPPGVVSGVSVPPIASARPRDRASPRPTPVSLSRSPSRWNGRKTRSRWVSGMPGPWSTTRSSTRSACSLAVTRGGRPAGLNRKRVADDVDQNPFEQSRVGQHRGQVVGDAQEDPVGRGADLVERPRYGVLDPDRGGCDAERAGLQAAHVEQVVDEPGEPVEGLVGGGEQLGAVRGAEREVATQARDGGRGGGQGVRRSWLTAASSAVRIRSASASGRAWAASAASRSCRSAMAACAANASTTRRSAAGRDRPRSTRVTVSSTGTSTSALVRREAGGLAHRRRDLPGVRVVLPVRTVRGVGTAFQERHRPERERLPHVLQQRLERAGATQHAAGDGGQRLGVRAGPGRVAGAPGGEVDDPGDRAGDEDEHDEREDVLPLGDAERPDRGREEVVQQQGPADRGQHRRPEPADQRDAHHGCQEQQHVAGQGQVGAEQQEEGGLRGQAHDGEREAGDPAARRERGGAGHERTPPALTDLFVGDEVDVDGPAQRGVLDVLPPLGVACAGDVGVRQFVNQSHLRPAGQDRVEVHLGERGAPVVHRPPWHDLQVADHRGGVRPVVGLDQPDDHVGAPLGRSPGRRRG